MVRRERDGVRGWRRGCGGGGDVDSTSGDLQHAGSRAVLHSLHFHYFH